MENEGITQEKFPTDLRRKVVADFVRDISEGRLFLSVDHRKWGPQDVELISNTTGRLIHDLSEYVSGAVAGEEFEFLEKQIFFSISVLRTYDSLKSKIHESRVEEELRALQHKVDSIGMRLDELFGPKQLEATHENKTDRIHLTPQRSRAIKKSPAVEMEKKIPPEVEEEGLF